MDLNTAVPIITGGLIITPVVGTLNAHRKDWCTYWKTGEYNLDRNKDTPDWAEMKSGQTGEWFLIKITRYDHPWSSGGGGVEFYTQGKSGHEHRNYWRLNKWADGKEYRRGISAAQKTALRCAGYTWPVVEKVIDDQLPTALKDLARSLDSVGARISNTNKTLKKRPPMDIQEALLTESVLKELTTLLPVLVKDACACKKEPDPESLAGRGVPEAVKIKPKG